MAVVVAAAVVAAEVAVGATVCPVNEVTWALAGVMAMRLLRATGQSTAAFSTDARRASPAV